MKRTDTGHDSQSHAVGIQLNLSDRAYSETAVADFPGVAAVRRETATQVHCEVGVARGDGPAHLPTPQ